MKQKPQKFLKGKKLYLANSIGVTRQSVSKYEKGIIGPSSEMIQTISCVLSFPIEFFYKAEAESTARSSSLFFRSNSNIAKKVLMIL